MSTLHCVPFLSCSATTASACASQTLLLSSLQPVSELSLSLSLGRPTAGEHQKWQQAEANAIDAKYRARHLQRLKKSAQ